MKEYDLISIGTGSAMNIVDAMIQKNSKLKVAVIDKDEPGGICLTRGCIPSKILLYPAELVRTIERAPDLGIEIAIRKVNFDKVMERMRKNINGDIEMIREGLTQSENIDYYNEIAEFVEPYTLKVGDTIIKSKFILLCTGSKPLIPPIKGLEGVGHHTSDTVLKMKVLPESIAIVGGGYVAAEYGHFFSAMGSKVTIIGKNPRFLPEEELEISSLVKRELQKNLTILTNLVVQEVETIQNGKKKIIALNNGSKEKKEIVTDEIIIAAGRGSNSKILNPDKGGIKTDQSGWIYVNEYLETSQRNVWAFGDANGKSPFKHTANYESTIVFFNAVMKKSVKVNYDAVPHAVFTYPEIASVGLKEKDAIKKHGKEDVLIGIQRYEDTAKGQAMNVKDYFVKVIVGRNTNKILGAHIVGPYASVLIQEIVNLMYTPERSAKPIVDGMHIHPALNEVVERAFRSLMPPEQYHHVLEHHFELPTD
jgi:dihydrolipoamide dehydrogenase